MAMAHEAGFTRQWECPQQPAEAVPCLALPLCVDHAAFGNHAHILVRLGFQGSTHPIVDMEISGKARLAAIDGPVVTYP
jgi:hypothetical protein